MSNAVTTKITDGLATIRLSRAHGNAINGDLIRELSQAIAEARDVDGVRGVLLAASGKLFCPGLDLQELIELDRPTMAEFLDEFSQCILDLYAFPKPMVAGLHGHAVAGGCVLALTADWRVLHEQAMVGLAEVRVGVPFPFGVAMILRESVPKRRLEEIVVFGRNYRGREALEAGLVQEVHTGGGFEPVCLERLTDLVEKDARAFSITKRYLRAATIERIRDAGTSYHDEFLDCWFSVETRQRIEKIVAELRSRDD